MGILSIIMPYFLKISFVSYWRPVHPHLHKAFYTEDSGHPKKSSKDAHTLFSSLAPLKKKSNDHTSNATYMYSDGSDNVVMIPTHIGLQINPSKRRNIKKNPKRTIQKIIKQNKKSRKSFWSQMTSRTTQTTVETESTTATTEPAQKKKIKKWNAKFNRNQLLPFQKVGRIDKVQKKDVQNIQKEISRYHRMRREVKEDRDVFILQDLDEVEFLSNEDGTNAIRAHVKKYW